ncbi:MAG: multidrug efflux RND transporter permease subunit [Phycisphaeraceae bacterium]|nr:multidrug efflux RND transporter permease subunit [Phycisphaeraceae bacterium]
MIEFFIKRPIFAAVMALLMLIGGGLSIVLLPVAQYPEITPPTVQVSANYPGASAAITSDVVTRPMEIQINGVEGMIYMSSASTNNGTSLITITFQVGYDQDIGAVDVQNRVSTAMSQLPEEVQKQGIAIAKQSTDLLLVVGLSSPNGTYDSFFLGNYADINLTPALQRVNGVGSVTNFGLLQYAIRIWIDPQKLAALGITPQEVAHAVSTQNQQVVGGQVGALPTTGDPTFTLQVNALGRLTLPSEFEDIVVRHTDEGAIVRIRDIGRAELGAASYATSSERDGKPSALLGIYQLPGANAFTVANGIRTAMSELSSSFPPDIEWSVPYDTTRFVSASITDLLKTFAEAVVLVLLVIFVFLQNFRSTLIPMIAIPVSIVGAFGIMLAAGFSINTLSLLGLVLAIGLVVDDAIVVVENVERQFEEGMTDTRLATAKAMREVTGPIVATTLSLAAVFVPAALMPGITGQLYNQFAMTIAFSVVLSGINSLSLSPALCALLLRPRQSGHVKFIAFRAFDSAFSGLVRFYEALVRGAIRAWWLVVTIFVAGLALTAWLFVTTPTAFIPDEDNGYFYVAYQLPAGSTVERSQAFAATLRSLIEEEKQVATIIEVNGFNFITSVQQTNAGFLIPVLTNWSERPGADQTANAIMARLRHAVAELPDGVAMVAGPPAIPGLGNVGGFQFQVNDQSGLGLPTLLKAVEDVIAAARQRPELSRLNPQFDANVPQLFVDFDRTKMQMLGINPDDAFTVLQINVASLYINQFNRFGKVYQVYVQADAPSRMQPDDVLKLYVRNRSGEQVPFSAFATVQWTTGPDNLSHYNVMNSVAVLGDANPGFSSGQAIEAVDAICRDVLPPGITHDWTGIVFQQLEAGNLAPVIFGLAVLAVFLFLAAQYESFALPVLVIVSVPLAALGAVITLRLFGRPLDVYAQIGLVLLVGLAAKNAILIVEFAKDARESGQSAIEAAATAARLRLRPILMTAFAFILGVVPLAMATGAGANSRHSIGYTVIGGLLVGTLFTLVVVPTFYVIVEWIRSNVFGVDPVEARKRLSASLAEPAAVTSGGAAEEHR